MNSQNPAVALVEAYEATQAEVTELRESLASVSALMQFEDRGWQLLAGASAGERLEGLEIEEVPVEIHCSACGKQYVASSIIDRCCPDCQSFATEVLRGSELEVTAMELEDG